MTMAQFRCRSCGKEGVWVYDAERFACPSCDSIDVQFIVERHELAGNDPIAKKMDELAAEEAAKKG
ncbi:hypothetical protein [Bradyrhizobium embrapense]